ncbi:MAG: cytochrome c [Ignavibacteriaceae bacterium]|nr:cytochrome c [Ignavibacteriaceae bacterium]
MKNLTLYMLFILAVIALYGFAYSIPMEDVSGEKIFVDNKCTMCHSVSASEITSKKKDAADLSKLSNVLTADFLTKYLKKEEAIDGEKHKVTFKGTEEDLNKMVEWLLTFKEKDAAK